MALISKRKVKSKLLDTSGRATLLGVLVTLLLTYGFLALFGAQKANAWPTKYTSCSTSGCHIGTNPSSTLSVAINGVQTTSVTTVAGGSFEIDWRFTNLETPSNVAVGTEIALPTGWTITSGTRNAPAGFTSTGTPAITWSTQWDAADGKGWATTNKYSTAGEFPNSPDGYTIDFTNSAWDAGTGGKHGAFDDGSATTPGDRDGTANVMGTDAKITVPPGTTAGTYYIMVLGIGHDSGNSKVHIEQQITVTVNAATTNSTTAGTATATSSTTGITVSAPYTGDANNGNTITVDYKLASASTWTTWGTSGTHPASPYSTSITGLTMGSTYDVRVTYNDADGVVGSSQQIISGLTVAYQATALNAWTNVLSATNAATTYTGTSSSFTPSAGSNRLLMAGFCVELSGAGTMSNPTVRLDNSGGTAFTQIAQSGGVSQQEQCYLGYLPEASITAGAHTMYVSATATGANITGIHVKTATYQFVDQTTPVPSGSSAANNSNTNPTVTVTFGTAVNYFANGTTVYIAGNGGAAASITTNISGFNTPTAEQSSSFTSFISEATNSSYSNFASTSQLTIGGTTSRWSAIAVAALKPYNPQTASVTNSPVTYTGSPQAATVTCSGSGSVSNIRYNGSATTPTNAGTYAITADCAATTNYSQTLGVAAGNFVINKATPTLSVGNSPQTYNGLAKTATINGSVAGTASNLTYNGSATAPTNTGTYAILADFTPTDSTNYLGLVGTSAGSFVINPLAVTLTGTRAYDGTTSATSSILSITNIQGSDNVTVASGSATLASATVGTRSISSVGTLALGGTSAANYTLSGASGSVTITQASTTTTVGATTPINEGQNATFTATVSPSTATGTIQFKVDGSNVGSPVTVTGGSATSAPVSGLTAGNHTVTAVYSGDTNYLTSTSAGVTQVVNGLTSTTTAVSPTTAITYGQNASFTATISPAAATGTVQFKVDGTNSGSPVTISGGSATLSGVSSLTAGSHTITAVYSGDGSYAASTSSGADQTVNPLAVTLTGSRAYDTTTSASNSILTVTNVQGSDTVTVVSGSATLASANAGTQAISSVGTLALGGASATNYTLTGATGSVTISKADSSITTWPTASNITYGQTLAASILSGGSATPSGSFAFTTPSTAPAAGTAAQSVTFTPDDTINYNSASGTVSVTVDKASQTISFPAPTIAKTYGAADFSAIATTSSLLTVTYQSDNTSVATVASDTGLVHIVGAGSAIITANLAGDSNYNPASAQTALTVDKAILTVSVQDASRVYGVANPAFTPLYSGFVNGETATVLTGAPELTTTATITSPAGSYPVYAATGTLAAANYSFSFGSGTLAIDLASQSITFNPLGNRTYGAAAFELAATGGASGNPVTFDSSDTSVATISGTTVTIVGTGTTTITASQAGTAGQYASATAQQPLTIDKAVLVVSAQNTSRVYGVANPAFTPLYSGFVYSDTASVLSGAPDLTTTATIASPVGSYPINASAGTLTAANYTFTFSTGSLGIDVAPQNIVFTALPGKTYGDTTFDLSATGGDSGNPVTFSSSNLAVATISGSTVTVVGAGSANITASQAGNSNYAAATALQTLTVGKAALTVSSQPASRTYGAANPTLQPAYSGFVNSDTSAVLQGAPDLSTTATAISPVADYTVTVTAGNLFSNNYNFSFVNGSLSVTKATLTVTADNASRAYGAADPVFTASYSGFVNGESAADISGQPTFSTTATVSSPAGTYPINPAPGTLAASNYTFVMQPGILTITTVSTTANLSVTLAGSGGGSVNSSPSGIACSSGSSSGCASSFTNGDPVTLTAIADWKSVFTGWGVPCSGIGTCNITLNGDSGVTATFAVNGQATILGHTITEYGSLQDAYNAATNSSIVAAHVYTFIENLTLDRDIAVTLDMGKGDLYLSPVGYTTLQGSLTIGKGTATIKNLIIK